MKKLTVPVALSLLIVGCARYEMVGPGRTTIDNQMSVDPQIAWTRLNTQSLAPKTPAQGWTVDGFSLDQLLFYPGIADNQPLIRQVAGQEKLPVFKKDMTAPEIMELLEATVTRSSRSTLTETHNLRPADFGGVPGFRFEMNFTLRDELPRKAVVVGTVKDDKLYMIAYQAPRIYYYEKYADIVERIIASVQFPGIVKAAATTK